MRQISFKSELLVSAEFLQNLPGYIFFKDTNSIFVGCNDGFANDCGCEHHDDVVGRSDFDFSFGEHAKKYREDDRYVISTGLPLSNLIELHARNRVRKYLVKTNKYPLFDRHKKIIGLYGHYTYLDTPSLCHSSNNNDDHLQGPSRERYIREYYSFDTNTRFRLTPREIDCAISMVEGRSARETAVQYSISRRTVESYIENIKSKLGCDLKSELVRRLIRSTFIYELALST